MIDFGQNIEESSELILNNNNNKICHFLSLLHFSLCFLSPLPHIYSLIHTYIYNSQFIIIWPNPMQIEKERKMGGITRRSSSKPFHNHLMLILMILAAMITEAPWRSEAQLVESFYSSSCPMAEFLVQQAVATKFMQTFVTIPATLRLFFHDCFVEVIYRRL